jgi:SAM-dependent methyltransferase
VTGPPPAAVVWHDVECGSYSADLPLWEDLAQAADGPILDVGAGTGRVSLHLADLGHEIVALDHDPVLLAALTRRAAGRALTAVQADAREFELGLEFALIVVPMQTIQLLGGSAGRARFLRAAHRHLRPAGTLAVAITGPLAPFEPDGPLELPVPDVGQHGEWTYFSQPVAVRIAGDGTAVIERARSAVSPAGERREERDEVRLDPLDAETLAAEARALGYEPLAAREVGQTGEHVGSTVVLLRR